MSNSNKATNVVVTPTEDMLGNAESRAVPKFIPGTKKIFFLKFRIPHIQHASRIQETRNPNWPNRCPGKTKQGKFFLDLVFLFLTMAVIWYAKQTKWLTKVNSKQRRSFRRACFMTSSLLSPCDAANADRPLQTWYPPPENSQCWWCTWLD